MPSTHEQERSIERVVRIRNPEGLHMRPCMQFCEKANQFASKVTLAKESQVVDGKSIMQVSMLAATQGTELRLRAVGVDAAEAVEALARVIERKSPDEE